MRSWTVEAEKSVASECDFTFKGFCFDLPHKGQEKESYLLT